MAITSSQLLRVSRQFKRYYEACFSALLDRESLTMRDLHVLLFLANNPGRDTARDVAELRGLPKSQVSGAVELLAARGLLRRLPDRRIAEWCI
jgi:MarR family transcriptional regulator for hemolysin